MSAVFADAQYWIALANPHDPWRRQAQAARVRVRNRKLVTTDEILAEALTGLSKAGPVVRAAAAAIVRAIVVNPNVTVVPQTRDTFIRALHRYEARLDKSYSLADCAAMNAMDDLQIREVLTHDRHFEQEGYTILIKR